MTDYKIPYRLLARDKLYELNSELDSLFRRKKNPELKLTCPEDYYIKNKMFHENIDEQIRNVRKKINRIEKRLNPPLMEFCVEFFGRGGIEFDTHEILHRQGFFSRNWKSTIKDAEATLYHFRKERWAVESEWFRIRRGIMNENEQMEFHPKNRFYLLQRVDKTMMLAMI